MWAQLVFLYNNEMESIRGQQHMKNKMVEMGFLKGIMMLFLVGFLIGIGVMLGFREYLSDYIYGFYDTLFDNLSIYEIEHGLLLKQVLASRFKTFFLLILLGVSILGIPSLVLFPVYKGFLCGFLFGSMLIRFSWKGLLLGLFYGFPQSVFYLPVLIAILHKNYCIGIQGLKKKLFLEQLPSSAMLVVILLIGCVAETYINSWIMNYTLSAIR